MSIDNDKMTSLTIGGLVPFTTIDMPEKLAAVVFCQGCPWRCRYCHNAHLQKSCENPPIKWDKVLSWLESRKGLLDSVIFSGGEPTLQKDLKKAINDVKTMGFEIGLHTGGCDSKVLSELLPALDWIGMDIKAPKNAYDRITGVINSGKSAWESLNLILQSDISYEVRTTYHPSLLSECEMSTLALELAHADVTNWVIQLFRPKGCIDDALTVNTVSKNILLGNLGTIFLQYGNENALDNASRKIYLRPAKTANKTNHRKFLIR